MVVTFLAVRFIVGITKTMVILDSAKSLANTFAYVGRQFYLATFSSSNQLNADDENRSDKDESESGNEIQSKLRIQTKYAANEASTEYLVYNWVEAIFAKFQMIVLWHDPSMTVCAISGILSSFLLLTYFAPRFYATVMIALLIHNLIKVWFRHVWPEIRVPPGEPAVEAERLDIDRFTPLHPQLMTLKELGDYIKDLIKACDQLFEKLLIIRREKPVLFCFILCSIFSSTAYIGNKVSGTALLFCILLAAFITPGIYLYLLPDSLRCYINQLSTSIRIKLHQDGYENKKKEKEEEDEHNDNKGREEVRGEGEEHIIKDLNIQNSNSSILGQILAVASSTLSISRSPSHDSNHKLISRKTISTEEEEDDDDDDDDVDKTKDRNDDTTESSDKSTSIIESDEEDKDGFVIL